MLIIELKPGRSIQIGDNVNIVFLGVETRHGVKLGITAPRQIAVDRKEVRERKRQIAAGVLQTVPVVAQAP